MCAHVCNHVVECPAHMDGRPLAWPQILHQFVDVLQIGVEFGTLWAVPGPLLDELVALGIQPSCQLLPLLGGAVQQRHQAADCQIRRRRWQAGGVV